LQLDEVAVIDEIQMMKDDQRGWAWTRALLGVQAEEIHLCGEICSAELLRGMLQTTGEDLEVIFITSQGESKI
jgi:ATP-dependent RNA helicase SUPV3L1/SUV3